MSAAAEGETLEVTNGDSKVTKCVIEKISAVELYIADLGAWWGGDKRERILLYFIYESP